MGIIKAFKDSVASSFADQWKEIITASDFDEHTLVAPGVLKTRNLGRGSNNPGSDGVISNGSKIFVPENTAAFVFNQAAIENTILIPGGYEYLDGDESVFNGDGVISPITKQIKKRFGFGGISPDQKRIAFVNLREIRDIKYGTAGPQPYHDPAYGVDLEVHAWGSFSIKVTDPELFVKSFVPPKVFLYSVDDPDVRMQIVSEYLQSFTVALNSMSGKYRVSQLASMGNEITNLISNDSANAGTWKNRFGFELIKATINSIELSDDSKDLLYHYAEKKMDLSAFDDVSQKASDISAQQKIAEGIQEHGFGNMGGMILGMNMAQGISMNTGNSFGATKATTIDQQLETLKKLKEALDSGILTQEEFDSKKKEILGL